MDSLARSYFLSSRTIIIYFRFRTSHYDKGPALLFVPTPNVGKEKAVIKLHLSLVMAFPISLLLSLSVFPFPFSIRIR